MNNKFLIFALSGVCVAFVTYIFMYPPTGKDNNNPTGDCPSITMPKVVVQNMINNYRNNQLVSIENATKNAVPNDAKSTWIDLKGLKTFIANIECKAPKGSEDLGIRIYYAAYPDAGLFGKKGSGYESLADFNNDEMTKNYGKKHTLILIPTTKINGVNQDFNPSGTNTKMQQKTSAIVTDSDVMAKNHFHLSPPHPLTGQDY
jgi:hypothetical protein